MELTKIKALLNGQDVDLPEEWQGLQIQSSFDNDSIQANITTEDFSFVGSARQIVEEHIEEGYFYEGLPFELQLRNGEQDYIAFQGFLNLQDSYTKLFTDRVEARAEKLNGLNTFGEKLGGVTFGFLDSEGLIESRDVEYVVEKTKNAAEIVVTSLMIYLMIKEITEIIRRIGDNIVKVTGLLVGGGLTNSSIGAAILAAGQIALDLAYAAVMVKAVVEMAEQLLSQFVSPVKKYKVCSYRELMKSASLYLGYEFESSITDLDKIHLLPSRPYDDKITSGVPRVSDAGYNCGEFFSIISNMFDAKYAIIDNKVHFENKDSTFWIEQSTFQMPSVLPDKQRKNGEELFGTRLVSFVTDSLDEWTIKNIKGTYFEIKTVQSDYKNGEEYLTIKNFDDRVIPYALGNRKDKLNSLERLIKEMAELVDGVVNAFGGSSNLSGSITSRVGMLRIGTDSHTVAKALYLENGKLPIDHRQKLSAKGLYQNYIKASSFVLSRNGGQKIVFEQVKIPFGFADFLQLIENSYFVTESGEVGKVISLNWTIDGDFAEVNYWIKDPNPTDKLIEQTIETE